MTHWWKDFNLTDPILGPLLPLTSGQQAMPISGVLPSGEAGFFDPQQDRTLNPTVGGLFPPDDDEAVGSGINYPFPYPNQYTANKYKLSTYPSGDFYAKHYAYYAAAWNQFSEEWWEESGILKTYGPDAYRDKLVDDQWPKSGSGTIHPTGLQSPFSNAPASKEDSINDFTFFNPYIHHERLPSNFTVDSNMITIPYVSTYRVSIDWDAYGQIQGYNRNYRGN